MNAYAFRVKIQGIIDMIRAKKKSLPAEAVAVMALLYANWQSVGEVKKITQSGIAKSERWLGCHPKYESARDNETTLRKVRQIIRDLRIEHGAPILSDAGGYWIPKSEAEVKTYLGRIEIEARAQAAAWFETYSVMDKMLGYKSKWFEAQKKLFEPEQTKLL